MTTFTKFKIKCPSFPRKPAALLFLLLMATTGVSALSQLLGNISVDDYRVSQRTKFNFDLISTEETVASSDYLEIRLSDELDATFDSGSPSCSVASATISRCVIVGERTCQITFSQRMTTTQIFGTVSGFINPKSNRLQDNIQIALYNQFGEQRTTTFVGSLSTFEISTLTGSLSSSSDVVGDKNAILTITVVPETVLAGNGIFVVNFPQYYESAGSDQWIGSTSPTCSSSALSIDDCSFNSASGILTISYETSDGEDTSSSQTFAVRSFKNPVKPETQTGFTLVTTDELGYAIAESEQLSLAGVDEPTSFEYVVFSFDDTSVVGQYSTFRIEIGMLSSLGRQCFIKVDFPDDFTIDNQLINTYATGFMRPSSGSSVSMFEQDVSSGIFSFEACQKSFGADPTGALVFQKVQNPDFIRDTGTFKVYVAADADFEDLIAFQTSGLSIESEQLQGGPITNISIEAQDTLISAQTAYNLNFTPASSISSSTEAKITIEFPGTLDFESNRCSILSRSSSFSNSMSCNLSGNTVTLSYIFANRPDFVGGTPLSVTISELTNPGYVSDIGAFIFKTFIKVNSQYYLQDQMTTNTNLVQFDPGFITKTSEVTSSSYQASKQDAIYVFEMEMQNPVPINGRIRINVPTQIELNISQITRNCYRLDYSSMPISLDCTVNEDDNYIDVIVRSRTFGSSGLPAGQVFRLQVAGLKNPREVNSQVAFQMETFDSSERLIDESTDSQGFLITMQTIGYFQSMTVEPQSPINGATGAYRFEIVPSMQIGYGDVLYITFPTEVQLPSTYYVECRGDNKNLSVNSCVKASAREIRITLTDIDEDYDPLDSFYVYVMNCVNPVSLKPSSVFSGIKLMSRYGNEIAEYYDDNLYVETTVKAEISDMRLSQSNLYPGEEAYYTIQFTPQTRLPSSTAFRVKTPKQIEIVRADRTDCYIDTNRQVKGVCQYKGSDVVDFVRGLSHMGSADYTGPVMMVFKAINPPSNFFQGVEIVVEISLDKSWKFPIASIQGGLSASFECNYPCMSCSPYDPDDCESCSEGGSRDRQFLQENVFTKKKTCVQQCELGFTWDKTVAKVCFPCDPSCSTCRQGGEYEDRRMCNSCAPNYGFQWVEEAKCFADDLGCPDGTYEYTKERCRACDQNCQICSSATNCLRCDAFSQTPLLQNEGCVSVCQESKTPVFTNNFGECVNCEFPCATCKDGNPSFCLTCATGSQQFLFGGQCLEACPQGTTRDLLTSKCIGCKQGCKECDLIDNSICIRCETGLSLFESRCRIECPVDFKKSADGTICEPRVYPFDRTFVPFPFIIMLGCMYVITIFCWILTKRRTLILQGFIISTAFVMQFAVIFSLLKSMAEGQALFITFNILVLIANVLIGVAFSITFHLQIDDYQFNDWREANGKAYKIMRIFFTFFSLHLFRLQYCKIFKISAFQASATVPHDFVRPIRLYSKLHIGVIMVPIFILNFFGMIFTFEGWWDNQLQMTMFEQVLMVPIMITMILIEILRIDPRALLHKPTDESPFFIGMFENIPKDGDKDFGSTKKKKKSKDAGRVKVSGANPPQEVKQSVSYWDLTDRKIRFTQLTNIIRTVKSLADTNLNNKLDELIDVHVGAEGDDQQIDECQSCVDLYHGPEKVTPSDFDAINMSFPGLNQDIDPIAKRMQLMTWFDEMADADAERERNHQSAILRAQMQVDQACMHDTELIDNCFFTSKEKVTAQAQTVAIELVEQAVSAKTLQSIHPKTIPANRSDYTQIADDNLDFDIQSQAPKKVAALSGINGETQRSLLTNQLVSERAKPSGKELVVGEDYEFGEEELMSGDNAQINPDSSQEMKDRLGGLLKARISKMLLYDKLGKRMMTKVRGMALYDKLGNHVKQKVKGTILYDKLGNQVLERVRGKVLFDKLGNQIKKDVLARIDEQLQQQRRSADEISEGDVAVDLDLDDKYSDGMSRTLSKNSHSQGLELELRKEHDSFEYEAQNGEDDRTSFEDDEEMSGQTISTQKRAKGQANLIFEKGNSLAEFMKEPMKPANSKNWIAQRDRIKTIILDEEVKAVMKEPHEGMRLKENYGRSEDTTEKTISVQESLGLSEQDRKNGNISEESYCEDDALFYKNNYPYDTHESISSVHTNEHEPVSKMGTRNDFTEWMRESVVINQRTFNVNDVIGNFPKDKAGRIINIREVIQRRNFRDFDGQLVNEKGYLINEISGAIRSRYTYEDIMIGEFGDMNEIGELPMPYRLEKYNFNPHKIMGSFDYCTKTNKPYFLRNKFNVLTDKLYRPVNKQGFLINERTDVIDNEGHVKFINEQLMPAGNLQRLHTYTGEAFPVQEIMGQFLKDDNSKEIILNTDPQTGKTVDMRGRLVNASGYLIDECGNIIDNKKGKLMFNFWEIMFQEPPKIFEFSEFYIGWVKGTLDRDVTKNPQHDDEYDLEGRLINTMGYLIDIQGNILDQNGKLVFRKDILKNAYGQDAKIPPVFTKRILMKPLNVAETDATPKNIVYSNNDQKSSFGGAYKSATSNGAAGANDETNVRSDWAPDAFSKSGVNQSGVFSDDKSIAKPGQASIQMSNVSKDLGRDNKGSLQLQDLNSSQIQLNIKIGGNPSSIDPKTAGIQSATTTMKQKKGGKSKLRQQSAHQALSSQPKQLRPAEKLLQNCYSNFVDGPTNTGGANAQMKKKGGVRGGGNRPLRSAVRNTRPAAAQTQQAFDSNSNPKVIMQGFMQTGSGGGNDPRSDYAAKAQDEIFDKSKQRTKQMTKKMLKQQQESALLDQNFFNMSLNQSNSGLLSNQLASATGLYQNQNNQSRKNL